MALLGESTYMTPSDTTGTMRPSYQGGGAWLIKNQSVNVCLAAFWRNLMLAWAVLLLIFTNIHREIEAQVELAWSGLTRIARYILSHVAIVIVSIWLEKLTTLSEQNRPLTLWPSIKYSKWIVSVNSGFNTRLDFLPRNTGRRYECMN